MTIFVREPRDDEYNQMVDVINSERELYLTVYSAEYLDKLGIGHETIETTKQELGKETRIYLVAVENEHIVGFVSWYIKPNNVAWVSMLSVGKDFYKRGVGGALVEKVENQAQKAGVFSIALEVQKEAHWALAFYKKHGYIQLSWEDLNRAPFQETLPKPPVPTTYILGKKLNNSLK